MQSFEKEFTFDVETLLNLTSSKANDTLVLPI